MRGDSANFEMLKLGRQAAGYTQEGFVEKIDSMDLIEPKVTQGTISKIEQGIMNASEQYVEAYAKVLDLPVEFFYQNESIFPLSAPPFRYRKRASVAAKELDQFQAKANIVRFCLKKLIDGVELKTNVPFFDEDKIQGMPSKAAQALRHLWRVPVGPIKNMTALLEENGIFVFYFDFGQSKIDGFSFNVQGSPATIFLNRNLPGDRERFTLAHELGHIVMHQYPTEFMEPEADDFASEFLMPSDQVSRFFMTCTLSEFIQQKTYWKVSIGSLIKKAQTLGRIDSQKATSLYVQISKKFGSRLNEPVEIPKEKPTLFEELVKTYSEELQYNYKQILAMLFLSKSSFEDLFVNPNKHLFIHRKS